MKVPRYTREYTHPERLGWSRPFPWSWGHFPPRNRFDAAAQTITASVMTGAEQRTYFLFAGAWLVTVLWFWSWWLRPEHWVSTAGMIVTSTLLAWTTLTTGWFLFWVAGMKEPTRPLTSVPGKYAIIVTKAPSEPWPMIRHTLEAMLAQDFPYPYDTWLADEDPTPEVLTWCARHAIQVSCRKGIPGYNNPSWPLREKCKEGNLMYFYQGLGMWEHYDFVAQLDADHVPTPRYLYEMMTPFNDPRVGYVAAPSICDTNAPVSWAARCRLHVEAAFHGPYQTGLFAPHCIGSHYAVRMQALREIGGLGPELAEDFSTTLIFNAYGWKGAFALRAIAHGEGPASIADFITQEVQWSVSLVRVLLIYTRPYWWRLTLRHKIQFGFSLGWYPLSGLYMLLAHLFPIIALLRGHAWVNVRLPEFFLHSWVVALPGIALMVWMRGRGWNRPVNASVFRWEACLYPFLRWPWVLVGCGIAVAGWLTHKEFKFKVTPKHVEGPKPLPLTVLLPYLLVSVVSAATSLLVTRPGTAAGYYYFCVVNAVLYLAVSLTIVLLHLWENRMFFRDTVRLVARPTLGVVVALCVVGGVLAERGESVVKLLFR